MSFQARYPGWCRRCSEEILPGDWIEYEDDKPVHVSCDDLIRDPDIEVPVDICPKCFQAKATNGACGCE